MLRFLTNEWQVQPQGMSPPKMVEDKTCLASEPQIEVMDVDYWKNAELTNGRMAMIGFSQQYITTSSSVQLYLVSSKTIRSLTPLQKQELSNP